VLGLLRVLFDGFLSSENDGSSTTLKATIASRTKRYHGACQEVLAAATTEKDRGVGWTYSKNAICFHSPLNESRLRRTTTPSLVIEEFCRHDVDKTASELSIYILWSSLDRTDTTSSMREHYASVDKVIKGMDYAKTIEGCFTSPW
jgi:hypothetical protein